MFRKWLQTISLMIVFTLMSVTSASATDGFVVIDQIISEGQPVSTAIKVKLVQSAGAMAEQLLKSGDRLNQGSELLVPSRTVIVLKSSNGNMITLQPSARFKVQHVGDDGETHTLESGKADFSVSKALSFFNVNYQHYTAMVRGTHYQVSVDPGKEFMVNVDEGKVIALHDARVLIKGVGSETQKEIKLQAIDTLLPGQSATYRLDKEEYLKSFGSYAEAEKYYREQLSADESSGDDDRIVRGLNALGLILTEIGKYQDAKGVFERMLKKQQSMPKPNLYLDAIGLANQAYCFNALGDAHKAIELTQKALDIDIKLFPAEINPLIAKDYNNLASYYSELGEPRKAIEYTEMTLAILDKLPQGVVAGSIATAHLNLGKYFSDLGDPSKGIAFTEKALALLLKAHPKGLHPEVALAYSNLGHYYANQSNPRKSLELMEKALAIQLKLYPNGKHPAVANSYNSLGAAYDDLGDEHKAIDYTEKGLDIQLKLYPDGTHPDLALSYNNIGNYYSRLGDTRKAILYTEKALAIELKLYPDENHPSVARRYVNLGSYYAEIGDARKGVDYAEKALAIQLKLFPDGIHPDVATGYNNLGTYYASLGNTRKAIESAEKALSIQLKLFPNGLHLDVARSYNNLGTAYAQLGDQRQAISNTEKALAIQIKLFPNEIHPDVASSYFNLGIFHINARGFPKKINPEFIDHTFKAIDYVKKSLTLRLKLYPDGIHPYVANCYETLAMLLRGHPDGQDYDKKAKAIRQKLNGR